MWDHIITWRFSLHHFHDELAACQKWTVRPEFSQYVIFAFKSQILIPAYKLSEFIKAHKLFIILHCHSTIKLHLTTLIFFLPNYSILSDGINQKCSVAYGIQSLDRQRCDLIVCALNQSTPDFWSPFHCVFMIMACGSNFEDYVRTPDSGEKVFVIKDNSS